MPGRILLINGLIADGSGRELRTEDLLIDGEHIAALGDFPNHIEAQRLDCTGLVVAPGFIDAHSHSDLQVLTNQREKVLQGVTSEVVGNCGFSPYPNNRPSDLRDFANGILHGGDSWGWQSASQYLLEAHSKARMASVYSLVGHGSLRISLAGFKQGPLDEDTIAAMESILDEALSDGATGLSTGLMYAPGSSAPADELRRLCGIVAKRDKIYCTHIRDYSTHLLEAIDEQIELARHAGCRLQVSHLQAVGKRNWNLNSIALERIEAARDAGIDVMFDCYPYTAGSTVLTQLLPQWALDGGVSRLLNRLCESASRAEIARQTVDAMVHDWSDILISGVGSQSNVGAVGKSIRQISQERNENSIETVFNLLVEEEGKVNMIQFNQSEENLKANLCHPLSIVISDGFYVSGKPHPRLHGAFPQFIGNISRDKEWLPLADAIQKVTQTPARRFAMTKRGSLLEGYFADITIFDPRTILSRSTYDEPAQPPVGIIGVIRNGNLLWWNRN